jgi:hypothetical protein
MYGKRGGGGFELYIPADVMASLLPTGQVVQLPDDPKEKGQYSGVHRRKCGALLQGLQLL